MTTTGTITQVDNSNQTTLITMSGMNGASGTSPSFTILPGDNVTIAVEGTWASATLVVNGSNDGGTTWFALKNWQNAAMSYTANSFDIFAPSIPLLLQFSWTGGGSGTTTTAYIGLSKKYY